MACRSEPAPLSASVVTLVPVRVRVLEVYRSVFYECAKGAITTTGAVTVHDGARIDLGTSTLVVDEPHGVGEGRVDDRVQHRVPQRAVRRADVDLSRVERGDDALTPMATVAAIFETMEYGPAPESDGPARAWLSRHGATFGHFIGELLVLVGGFGWAKALGASWAVKLMILVVPGVVLDIPQTTHQETDSTAVFFEGDYAFNEHWTLNLGGRYTKDEKSGTRFIVEVDMSRMGPFQFDGLVRESRMGLVLISHDRAFLDHRTGVPAGRAGW